MEQQPTLFDTGEAPPPTPRPTYHQLEERLNNLRQVKCEVEEDNDFLRKRRRYLKKKVNTLNEILYKGGDVHKALYKAQQFGNRAMIRIKELTSRITEVQNDYKKLEDVVKRFRPELKCAKCGMVKKIECFAKDVTKFLGRENRCRLCIREKTQLWRAKKLSSDSE